METSVQHNISVRILDRTYQIKCPADMVQEVQDSARYVDREMRKIRDSGVFGSDRVAVMAALNIAYELWCAEQRENKYVDEMFQRIQDMQAKVQEVLTYQGQMEL
jgi:cell division protein ZapA